MTQLLDHGYLNASFLALRSAPSAQYEIRVYSDEVGKIVEQKFPRTWALFAEGR